MKLVVLFLFLGFSASAEDMGIANLSGITCESRLRFEHDVHDVRCRYRDEVMVGISNANPLVIRCAQVEIQCRQSTENTAEENQS